MAINWTQTASLSKRWKSCASSADGTKLIAAAYGTGSGDGGVDYLYTSTDSGVSWTQRDPPGSGYWRGVASSADGVKLVAVHYDRQIYTSTDSGASWTARDSNRTWQACASSADGTKLIAVADNVLVDGYVYTSTDSGASWTQRATSQNWRACASSADGSKLIAVTYGGYVYTSTDSGASWTQRATSQLWTGCSSSADGTKLVAVVSSGYVYTSTDSGASWTQRAAVRAWTGVASSIDGVKLIATVYEDYVYKSINSGVDWTATATQQAWMCCASSYDGLKLLAGVDYSKLYTGLRTDFITYRDLLVTDWNVGTSSPVITKPAGTVDDDLILIFIVTETPTNITVPTGWALAGTEIDAGSDCTTCVIYKVASSEPATWTLTNIFSSASRKGRAVALVYSNASSVHKVNQTTTTGTSCSGPSVTPTVEDCRIIQFVGCDPSTSAYAGTPDAIGTERIDSKDANNNTYTFIQDYLQSTVAAIALNVTGLTSDNYGHHELAISMLRYSVGADEHLIPTSTSTSTSTTTSTSTSSTTTSTSTSTTTSTSTSTSTTIRTTTSSTSTTTTQTRSSTSTSTTTATTTTSETDVMIFDYYYRKRRSL